MHNLGTPNNGYGMRLVRLRNLRADSAGDAQLITQLYPEAKLFVSRVLYLVGLLWVSGIVHGISLACVLVFSDAVLGDIKLSNFALSRFGQLMLLDFSGSAADGRTEPAQREPVVDRDSICGVTAQYQAPELRDTSVDKVDSRVDVYSCGVMFTKLLEHELNDWEPDRGLPLV